MFAQQIRWMLGLMLLLLISGLAACNAADSARQGGPAPQPPAGNYY